MTSPARAPRFLAYCDYLEKKEGGTLLTIPRKDWELIDQPFEKLIKIDFKDTPLAGFSDIHSICAAIRRKKPNGDCSIEIYRYDPKDDPTPINKDTYLVWEQPANHIDVNQIVNSASTRNDSNLWEVLDNTVFILKEKPGKDHWLPELPVDVVEVLMKST